MPDRHYGRRISDSQAEPQRSRWNGSAAYLYANAFEASIAVATVVAAIVFFAQPGQLHDTVLGRILHPWDTLWNFLYLLSGIFIFSGLLVNRGTIKVFGRVFVGYTIELAGLIFLITAMLSQAIAIVSVTGLSPALATFLAIIAAALLRGRAIVASRKVGVPVEVPTVGGDK